MLPMRCKWGKPGVLVSQHTGCPRSHRDCGALGDESEKLSRDQPQLAYRSRQRRLGPHPLHDNPHHQVCSDEEKRGDG
jgi:hypothetical protein